VIGASPGAYADGAADAHSQTVRSFFTFRAAGSGLGQQAESPPRGGGCRKAAARRRVARAPFAPPRRRAAAPPRRRAAGTGWVSRSTAAATLIAAVGKPARGQRPDDRHSKRDVGHMSSREPYVKNVRSIVSIFAKSFFTAKILYEYTMNLLHQEKNLRDHGN
jgi:hypothetical protein